MISLYIHIPFCKKKCRYCDFVSYECALHNADSYIDALLNEARLYSSEQVATAFIGGGTPSLLSVQQLNRLVCGLKRILDFSCCTEFTIEANPDSLTEEKLDKYKELGINRLSIGLQSTLESELKLLGRIHTFKQFVEIYNISQKYFDNINVDLISALPNQTINDFSVSLSRVVDLSPAHISVYSLIPEEGTPLYEDICCGNLNILNEDTDRDIYAYTGEFLRQKGYGRYEISNYSKRGFECKHNLTYWTGKDYVGLGCAAHSLYNGERSDHTANIEEYISTPEPQNFQKLTDQDIYEEYIMLRLRLIDGFDLCEFKSIFGYDFYLAKQSIINELMSMNLVKIRNGRFMLSDKGLDVCDSIVIKLI